MNSSQRDICVEDFEGEGARLGGKKQLKGNAFIFCVYLEHPVFQFQ